MWWIDDYFCKSEECEYSKKKKEYMHKKAQKPTCEACGAELVVAPSAPPPHISWSLWNVAD